MTRKILSGEGLISLVHDEFSNIKDHRRINSVEIPLKDSLMSAFAVFSLKFPSLFKFEEEMATKNGALNLKALYGIENIPSDTQMRSILDEVEPENIRPVYSKIFSELQRGKALEVFRFYQGYYLIAVDGTGYFESKEIHCDSCQVKLHQNGEIGYSHQMLGMVLVHPDSRVVVPLCPEPIIKPDGSTKNDCERNASKRIIKKFREDHPKLKGIMIEDAISANIPHIDELIENDIRFILGVKPGSNSYLFKCIPALEAQGRLKHYQFQCIKGIKFKKTVTHKFCFVNGVRLMSSSDQIVNFLDYSETTEWIDAKGRAQIEVKHFSWITDLDLNIENIYKISQGGRTRWRIENETFNTLKNQGYQFEHNFGHGYKNLSVLFAFIMMLVFLVDQSMELTCEVFQAALKARKGRRTYLWESLRGIYIMSPLLDSWTQLMEFIAGTSGWRMVRDTS